MIILIKKTNKIDFFFKKIQIFSNLIKNKINKKVLIKLIFFKISILYVNLKSYLKVITLFFKFKSLNSLNFKNKFLNFGLKKNINLITIFIKKQSFKLLVGYKLNFMIRGISYKFVFYKKKLNIYLLLRLGFNYKIFFLINLKYFKFNFTE